MFKKRNSILFIIYAFFGLVLLFGVVYAWTNPFVTPPGGEVGPLPVSKGGTGLTSVGAGGNILVSNGTSWVSSAPGGSPAGSITMYGGSSAPSGWFLANGSAVSRVTYSSLFAVIGTTYGAGDGSTTFNLPDLKGRVAVGNDAGQTEFDVLGETGGEKTHTLTVGEMPTHNHIVDYYGSGCGGGTGTAISLSSGGGCARNSSTSGSGLPHNNLQPYLVLNYIIKY